MEGAKGKNAPNYKKIVGKSQVHKWLYVHYGKLELCEGKECTKKTKFYEWALKKGKKYLRDRNNFLRLCRSCHRKYDLNEEKRLKALDNLWWRKGINKPTTPYTNKLDQIFRKRYTKKLLNNIPPKI